jgi:hypothetical protein
MNQEVDYLEKYHKSWLAIEPILDRKYRVYDYSYSPFYNNYNDLYKFVFDNIATQWEDFNVKPCYFFFNDDIKLQAIAMPRKRVITIFKGLIEELKIYFESYKTYLNSLPNEKQPNLLRHLDAPIDHLMFQMTTQFLYYHELGHIIQVAQESEKSFFEAHSIDQQWSKYSFDDHVLEMDSDDFAAHFVINHIIYYWQKLPLEAKNQQSLEFLFATGIAGIYILFYLLSDLQTPEMWYKAHTHPHDITRSLTMTIRISDSVAQFAAEHKLSIETDNVIRESLLIIRDIISRKDYEYFKQILSRDSRKIVAHISEIQKEFSLRPWLASYKMAHRNRP